MQFALKEIRNKKKISQEEMASLLHTTYRTYGSWEREETKMPLQKAIVAADVFNCTLDMLVGRETISLDYDDPKQEELNNIYKSCNPIGRERIFEYAQDILSVPRYRPLSNKSDNNRGITKAS